ncbi:MAG: type II secretion system minor pseudopilin GspI [Steroidobacteraceae bacterium]
MRARGFTLIEVLVALVIVAAGAAAVLAALSSAATSTSYLRDKTFAQWIADNRMSETRLASTAPATGTRSGDVEFGGQRWQWQQRITDTEFPGVRRIDVSVRPFASAGTSAGGEDASWTYTLTGILGQDLAPPDGQQPVWEPPPPDAGKDGDGTKSPAGPKGTTTGGAGAPGSAPGGTPAPEPQPGAT